jgi:hypothetical protein
MKTNDFLNSVYEQLTEIHNRTILLQQFVENHACVPYPGESTVGKFEDDEQEFDFDEMIWNLQDYLGETENQIDNAMNSIDNF